MFAGALEAAPAQVGAPAVVAPPLPVPPPPALLIHTPAPHPNLHLAVALYYIGGFQALTPLKCWSGEEQFKFRG